MNTGNAGKFEVIPKMVSSTLTPLRGFAGIGQIYINYKHFSEKRCDLTHLATGVEKDKLILLDIISLAIHEFAHVKIRQVPHTTRNL